MSDEAATMKAIYIVETPSDENSRIKCDLAVDFPSGFISIKGDHALVKVAACSVNCLDTSAVGGKRSRFVPGNSISGVVTAVGIGFKQKSGIAVGQEVIAFLTREDSVVQRLRKRGHSDNGGLAEYVAVRYDEIALKPPHLNHVQACLLPGPGLVALNILRHHLKRVKRKVRHGINSNAGKEFPSTTGSVAESGSTQSPTGYALAVTDGLAPVGFGLSKSVVENIISVMILGAETSIGTYMVQLCKCFGVNVLAVLPLGSSHGTNAKFLVSLADGNKIKVVSESDIRFDGEEKFHLIINCEWDSEKSENELYHNCKPFLFSTGRFVSIIPKAEEMAGSKLLLYAKRHSLNSLNSILNVMNQKTNFIYTLTSAIPTNRRKRQRYLIGISKFAGARRLKPSLQKAEFVPVEKKPGIFATGIFYPLTAEGVSSAYAMALSSKNEGSLVVVVDDKLCGDQFAHANYRFKRPADSLHNIQRKQESDTQSTVSGQTRSHSDESNISNSTQKLNSRASPMIGSSDYPMTTKARVQTSAARPSLMDSAKASAKNLGNKSIEMYASMKSKIAVTFNRKEKSTSNPSSTKSYLSAQDVQMFDYQ